MDDFLGDRALKDTTPSLSDLGDCSLGEGRYDPPPGPVLPGVGGPALPPSVPLSLNIFDPCCEIGRAHV